MGRSGMTDNEIVKALECCVARSGTACSKCPYHEQYYDKCTEKRNADIVDLINRQKLEIERLKRALNTDFSFVRTRCSGKTKRINEIITFRVETIKAEAIKEFAERLLNEYATMSLNSQISIDVVGCDIKRIVKEMVGEAE